MKTAIILAATLWAADSAWAQGTPPPGTISRPLPSARSGGTNTPSPVVSESTNQVGTSVSLNQLTEQLRELQSTVEHALPSLTTFTTQNTPGTNGQPGIAGRVAGILQGILGGTATNSTTASSSEGVLGGILSTNSGTSVTLDPKTFQALKRVQTDLQELAPLLQELVGNKNATDPDNTISRQRDETEDDSAEAPSSRRNSSGNETVAPPDSEEP